MKRGLYYYIISSLIVLTGLTGCQLAQNEVQQETEKTAPVVVADPVIEEVPIEKSAEIAPIPIAVSTQDNQRYMDLMVTFMKGKPLPKPSYSLFSPGQDEPIDYKQYGEFKGLNTDHYTFIITNLAGLQEIVGEAVYPNEDGIYDNPIYRELVNSEIFDTSYWDSLKIEDTRPGVFIWAEAHEAASTRAYFTAVALERAGHIMQALKAYHAVLIHYPAECCWSADSSFVWYLAPAALGNIYRLCQTYPELGITLQDAHIAIENDDDTDMDNDIAIINPGTFINETVEEQMAQWPVLTDADIVTRRGTGLVHLVKYSNGHWQLRYGGQPFVIRGVSYSPTEVGIGPSNDRQFGSRWMFCDNNTNGLIDAPYEAWVDQNTNGIQDLDEPAVGDFQLLSEMGCNAIRYYLPTTSSNTFDESQINKALLRDMFERYGIGVIAGDFLGAYTIGSGADWATGTDYTDPMQRVSMKDVIRQKVMALRDEPWLLMWLIGNENNMRGDHKGINATRTNASAHPEAYASFLNEVAEMIHELDPNHPVAIGNLETGLAEHYARMAPAIDIFGINSYRGAGGFGGLFNEAQTKFDRPVLIIEYGCDAYAEGEGVDEPAQAGYHENGLKDIVLNQAGGALAGNSIGGIVFQYVDEWWKAKSPRHHQTKSQWRGPLPDGYMHEEWLGITGQGTGSDSPRQRHLRETYYMYKNAWGQEK